MADRRVGLVREAKNYRQLPPIIVYYLLFALLKCAMVGISTTIDIKLSVATTVDNKLRSYVA